MNTLLRILRFPLLICMISFAFPVFSDDDANAPHHGNPPLHAQDKMRAFHDDHHEPQNLSSLNFTSCSGGLASGYPCRNVDLMAFLPLSQIGGGNGNDIWGWTDPLTGKEYAIMGRTSGTSFVDVSDPSTPVYLGNLPPHASNSTWRDIKVYANHAFIVSEATQSGMQVFNLTQLRNVSSPPVTFSETAWYSGFSNAHNLVINEDTGYAYAVGSNTCSGGLHMVNISNPTSPTSAGCFSSDGYTHDAQCVLYHGPDLDHQLKEICLNSNEDTLTIVDVTNKSAPAQLSRKTYSGVQYTHQGWLTEDHVYFLIDDELDESRNGHNTRTYIWNVSNLDNPALIGSYTSSVSAIDHNQYVKGNYSYQSNYRAGLRILDISDIANGNLTEAGYFDIYPSSDSPNFNGSWSNYPFFTSGIIVVSGIEQGLYVLRPNLGSPSTAPTVSIFRPAENETVGGDVTLQIDAADAEDPPGSLTVEWNVNGGPWQPTAFNNTTGFYEANWDASAENNGPATLNARATDSSNQVGTDSNLVNISNPLPAFHVSSIEVVKVRLSGGRYRAVATVTIVDAGTQPVSDVMVEGTFSGDWSGNVSSATDTNGQANFQTSPVKNGSNWTFCVVDGTKTGWSYNAAANVETCDSTGGISTVGAISGLVTDSVTSFPIAGAGISTDTGESATSDSAGNYTISSVPTGSRTVTASANGYDSQQQQTTVTEGNTSIVNFALIPSTSGGSGTIKGTVTNTGGSRLGGILVQTNTGQSVLTNKSGKYTIQGVPAGNVTVTASGTGYVTQQQVVTLATGQTLTVDFSLASQ